MTRSMHLATKNDGLGSRLVVAYKQIPDSPLNALVINIDKLVKNVDRDELMAMVHSMDAQHERDFINVLHRKGLLEFYHKAGYFEAVPIDNVVMTPEGTQRIPLREVINAVNAQNGVGPLPTQEQMNAISTANPYGAEKRSEVLLAQGNAGIAKSVLIQASLMLDEANKKFAEALSLDPSLRNAIDAIKAGKKPNVNEVMLTESPTEANDDKIQNTKKRHKSARK